MTPKENARAIAHVHERRAERGCEIVMEADDESHTNLCNQLTHDIQMAIEFWRTK
jgi:hypothetical protein